MKIYQRLSLFLIVIFPTSAICTEILDAFPSSLKTNEKYIIYLHGQIIEDKGRRPTHPAFGIYEYDRLLQSFLSEGYNVIADVRKPNTDPSQYAKKLANIITHYQAQGPVEINLVGFSKGAIITLLTSSQLKFDQINYAILAGCWASITKQNLQLSGNILSMYDRSDSVGSCRPFLEKTDKITSFKEIIFDTQKSHGLFFKPNPIWQQPLFNWLESKSAQR